MVTMNISDLQAQMLDRLSNEQVASVFPLIEKMLLESKQQVKTEAISLVKGFFPDPHAKGHECSDCLLIDSLAETIEVYLPVKVYDEDA